MRPIIIFQVKGYGVEVDSYDKGVIVSHQAKGVVDTQSFTQYFFLEWRKMPITEGGVRFVVCDGPQYAAT